MRKALFALPLLAAAIATPALAQSYDSRYDTYYPAGPAIAGAAVGTAAGVGLYNGWYGSGAFATSLGASTAASIAAGGVIGVGTVALVDAAIQPCRGFHALFDLNHGRCVNGVYVGDQPPPRRRAMR